ncbi:hypothetical protein [Streptomyces sp. NPDC051310]|uniref:hypothetical protein n=1 Tax=Streptomyces sp. NPDC051310 TaxID=3365649 RepID=UPI00378764CB
MPDQFAIELKVRSSGWRWLSYGTCDVRPPATAEELEQFETDVLAGFVLARAPAATRAAHAPAPVVLGFLEEQHPLSAVRPGRRDPADQVVEVP